MADFLDIYLGKAARFGDVVRAAPDERWSSQSPCDKWSAADVVDHLVDTEREFFARNDLDLGARPTGSPGQVWEGHLGAVRQVLGDGSVLHRSLDGFFGPTTLGDTLVSFYALDLVVHRWDLARALGLDSEFSADEMDLLDRGIAVFGEHMYDEGVFGPAVAAPADASRQERLLAVMGRTAR